MKVVNLRFRCHVEGPDGKPLIRLVTAVLKDGLVRHGKRRYPLHMVESFEVDACPVCGELRPDGAKGVTCGDRSCRGKVKKKPPQPEGRGSERWKRENRR